MKVKRALTLATCIFVMGMSSHYVGQEYSIWLRALVLGLLAGIIAALFIFTDPDYRQRRNH
ncbi:MAG: hypothetical protein HY706_06900 [Candidatus Hydrogenedentes bacterium]|nr:hypothetical protein [Candidatus Hydrogenedentota bacterium]